MLTVETLGAARWQFSEDGKPYAEVGKFVNNSITIEGTEYQLSRNAEFSFALIGDYGPVMTAEWTGVGTFTAEWQSSRFVLTRRGRFRSKWELLHNDEPAGTIRSGFMSYTADLSTELPLPVRTFLVYVVTMAGMLGGRYTETNHN